MSLNAECMRAAIGFARKEGFEIEQNPTVGFMTFSNETGSVHVSFEFLELIGELLQAAKLREKYPNGWKQIEGGKE